MAHPLDGSRAKIERAGDHLEVLDAALARFIKDGGFEVRSEQDPDTGEYVGRVLSNRQPPVPPPLRLSVLLGDALNNLRSALDYVVWQLAESPSKKNQFPIFDTPEGFESHRERYLCSVPRPLWAKFEAYQPYQGPDRHALRVLAKLNDVDKHRLLLAGAVKGAMSQAKFNVSGLDSIKVKTKDWAPLEDGAEIYRMRLEPHAGSQVKVHAEVPFTVVFGDPDSGFAVNIVDMRKIMISVSNVVETFVEDFPPGHDS
jgi:hypothetical protein